MKQIKIVENYGKVKTSTKGTPSFDDAMLLLFTSALGMMNQVLNDTPLDKKEDMKHYLYDSFNEAASATLVMFAPDNELRPDLTVEALRDLEDKKMSEYIEKAKKIGALDA